MGYNDVYLTIAGELVPVDETGSSTAVSVVVVIFEALFVPPAFGYPVDTTDGYSLLMALLATLTLFVGIASLGIGAQTR